MNNQYGVKRKLLVAFFFFLSSYATDDHDLDDDRGLELCITVKTQDKKNKMPLSYDCQPKQQQFLAYPDLHITREIKEPFQGCKLCCILAVLGLVQCGPCVVCM